MRTRHLAIAALVASAALAACAETPAPVAEDSQFGPHDVRDIAQAEHGVTVRTRFILTGVRQLRDERGAELMALDDLYVNVGALFLDPADQSSVAFSSREPFDLSFDVSAGQTDIHGPEFELPFAGDFFVSMQVEPGGVLVGDDKADDDGGSLVVRGRYFDEIIDAVRADEPSPLPWDPKDVRATDAVAFTYRSDAVARMQLGEVHLREKGTYELVLTVNVEDWLRDDVLPAVRAHRASITDDEGAAPARFEDDELDVDTVLDEAGSGVESLVGGIDIGTRRY